MRPESEQLRPPADTSGSVPCAVCRRAMEDAGRMDAWLFFQCSHCELVWRLTPEEFLEQIGGLLPNPNSKPANAA